MPTCPLCNTTSPPGTATCQLCGKYDFAPEESAIVAGVAPQARTVRGPLTIPAKELEIVATPLSVRSAPLTVAATAVTPAVPAAPVAPPRLVVARGLKLNAEFPLYEGKNYIGRSADTPADIDLTLQEPTEQVWTSRQHALVTFEKGLLVLEDLNSLNGTFVNRARLHPGQRRLLQPNDVIAVGTVHLRVVVG